MDSTVQSKDNFNALYSVTQIINSILEPAELLNEVLALAMKHLEAERGFLILVDYEHEKGFSVVASNNFSSRQASHELAASSSVVKQVLESGESVLTFDATADERFEASTSIIAQKILSIICIPLRVREKIIGAVYLDSTKTRKTFTDESVKFLTIFGNLSAIAIENAKQFSALRKINERLRNEVTPSHRFSGIIGESKKWRSVLDIAHRVLDVDVSVMITGESGTGKELIARAIHENGSRGAQPFVAINCSAIPENLLESELFGYKKGSFTGAHFDKKGLFEFADGGTIFLDEIGELPALLQTKILRVLQEKEIRRVGDVATKKVDVRIIAATNRELKEEVKAGRFREDLYFRLNVVALRLPPLRERVEDIPALAMYFFKKACETHKRNITAIQPDAMKTLMTNPWQGNVRELQNVIERAVVLCKNTTLASEDVATEGFDAGIFEKQNITLEDFEKQIIEATLREMDGNRTRTAKKLGVSLRWLQYRVKEWNLE